MRNTRLILRALILTIAFGFSGLISQAQQQVEKSPLSFNEKTKLSNVIPTFVLPTVDMQAVQKEDSTHEANGGAPHFAKLIPVNLTLENSGNWETLYNGDRVWRLAIQSRHAQGLTILYSNFYMPKGATFHIYNEDKSQVLGAFTSINNKSVREFATGVVGGEVSYLEYYEPANVRGEGIIDISAVGHGYRFLEEYTRGSDPCEVDINCSEGSGWQDEKRGVVRILVVDGGSQGWCTGSLVNNTALDCKNYVLTALHCGVGSTTSNFNQYIFYFNYERSGCGSGSSSTSQSITGCAKRASSNDGGGNSGSDFLLVELNNNIPSSYNPYYNGWNASTTASSGGVGIHHPAGDRKKISTYTQTLTTTSWGISGTHWRVYWVATANGHGVTEGGSSGSPLFDNQGRIVGTLTGGGSYCVDIPNPSPDAYGKMSYHWGSNPGDDLSDYLDPGNTGSITLAGTYAPCTPPNNYDAGITAVVSPSGTNCSTNLTPVVTLKNFGATTLTSVTISYNVDNGPNSTYTWAGSLATNATTNVTLPAISTSSGAHTFNAFTSNPNGQTDAVSSNDASSGSFTSVVADDVIHLIINTDAYGSETTWELRDNQDNVVYSGGPYGNNTHLEVDLCVVSNACYTFYMYDTPNGAPGDGMCCDYGQGSYSLGFSDNTAITTGGEFGDQDVTGFCVPVSNPGCDTLAQSNFINSSGYTLYGINSGGYVTGTNSYGDFAKAQVYQNNTSIEIEGVLMWIAAKENVADDANAKVTVNVYDLDGPGTASSGAVNNAPGTVLASATVFLERLDTAGFFTLASFNNPPTVSSDYAVGVDFTTLGTNDEVGIVSSVDGDANGTELAWEKWDDGTWHSLLSAWDQLIDGDIDLGLFPIECTQVVGIEEAMKEEISVYPNPSSDLFTIEFNWLEQKDLSITVYNIMGKLVFASTKNNVTEGKLVIDLSNESSGMYFINVDDGKNIISKKVMLRK